MGELVELTAECRACGKDLGASYVDPKADLGGGKYVQKHDCDCISESHHVKILCEQCRADLVPKLVDMVKREIEGDDDE